ncbi:MAG: hypothetical protein H7274_03560 [Rhodoferax sp.]|nr:hypothetical protein [Rhodoferax sp.]
MKFHKFSAAVLAIGLTVVGAASAVPSITLNPSALNGGAVGSDLQIDTALLGQQGAFVVTSIQTRLDSFLNISTKTGTGSFTETGALIFTTYNTASFLNGNRLLGGGQYDIYGLFSGSGSGLWTGNQFNVNSISSFVIDIWASPQNGTTIALSTGGGIVKGNKDFKLGTATFSGSFGGTNAQLGFGNAATTQLTAEFAFNPANAAYTGAGGYFMAPDPFMVNFNGSGSSNSGQSTFADNGSGWLITTGNGATGNLTPLALTVPEPGALTLVSLALLAAGFASSRKRSVAA